MRKTTNKMIRRQRILIAVFSLLFVLALVSIFLAVTVFRPFIPFFRLVDGDSSFCCQGDSSSLPVGQEHQVSGVGQTYMVLGSDYRPDAGFRTDVMVLVMVNPVTAQVSLVSFPRDLWVAIPGVGEQRINTVMQTGGFDLLAATMQQNFGIRPQGYFLVDMEGFIEVVDILGGVEVFTDRVTADSCDVSMQTSGWCTVGPGKITMNSAWALWYVRARYQSSDFDRMRRVQEVGLAIIRRAVSLAGVAKATDLIAVYETYFETNLNMGEAFLLSQIMLRMDESTNVKTFSIGPDATSPFVTMEGASVLLPNSTAVQEILRKARDWVER